MQISPDANVIHVWVQNRQSLYRPPSITHFPLCVIKHPTSPAVLYWNTLMQTLPGDNLEEWEKCNHKRHRHLLTSHSNKKSTVQWAFNANTHKHTQDKPLTCPSWRRRANTDSLKLLYTFLHTVGNSWRRSPGANGTTEVCKKGKQRH